MPEPAPATVGRYQIVRHLGQGAVGTLFLAHDPSIDRMVAIKIMRDETDDPDQRARFQREARAAGRLRHPNIVTVFDVGEADGRPFIAMEYVPGDTVAAIIRRRQPLAVLRKLKLLDELCDGLSYAHKAGLVHRDIKPSNLILDADGVLKILDFGIVRLASSGLTQSGVLMGTLAYMSPEQVAGQPVDHRSDIFAVGSVAYELFSYKQAFPGSLQDGILHRVLHEAPEPLAQLCPGLDPEIITIVDKALEKSPDNRYQDLKVMRGDLARARRRLDEETSSEPEVPSQRAEAAPLRTPAGREELTPRRAAQIDAYLEDARRAVAAGSFDAAIEAAERALVLDPEHERVLAILDHARSALDEQQAQKWLDEARFLLQREDVGAAAELVERARSLQPAPAVDELQRAIDGVRRDIELRLERKQVIAEALARARAELERGGLELALRAADEVLVRDSQHIEALRLKEQALAGLAGRAGESRPQDLRTVDVEHAITLAERLFADGLLKPSLRTIDQGLTIDPQNTRLHQLRARILSEAARRRRPAEPPSSGDVTVYSPRPEPAAEPVPQTVPSDDGTMFFRPPAAADTDAVPDVQLVISAGNPRLVGRTFKVTTRSFTIGRGGGDLVLPEPSWTRRHAVIEYGDTGFTIRDLGSSNGTYVNGKAVSDAEPLFFGATIQIGQTVFTFTNGNETNFPDLTDCVIADRYVLTKLLRESAKGVVYLARDRRLPGEVVVKLLSPELVRYPGYRDQFQREAEMAAELRHPHICRVMDYGSADIQSRQAGPITTHFLCLEFMAGGTLAARLDANVAFAADQVARWIGVLADALQYAHKQNVIHGNLKPTSVVFDMEENVYLTDFAIAQRLSSGEGKPVVGTAAYMAPEQWNTGSVTTAIDQFALAALAYYMTTGSRPFEGQDHPEVRRQNFRRGPMPAHEEAARNGRDVPAVASRVMRKALAMTPAERFPSVADFGRAFGAAVSGTRIAGGVPEIFLSYQREGAAGWAQFFARELKDKHGISVFVDVERRDGAGRFPARLAQAIEECDVFVVILGGLTLESKWVREEISLAYQHGRPMVPVFQESWHPPDVAGGTDPPLETLMSFDGVHLLDRRNIHVDHTIADLARLVKSTLNPSPQS